MKNHERDPCNFATRCMKEQEKIVPVGYKCPDEVDLGTAVDWLPELLHLVVISLDVQTCRASIRIFSALSAERSRWQQHTCTSKTCQP